MDLDSSKVFAELVGESLLVLFVKSHWTRNISREEFTNHVRQVRRIRPEDCRRSNRTRNSFKKSVTNPIISDNPEISDLIDTTWLHFPPIFTCIYFCLKNFSIVHNYTNGKMTGASYWHQSRDVRMNTNIRRCLSLTPFMYEHIVVLARYKHKS